jgi:hypothetical protein
MRNRPMVEPIGGRWAVVAYLGNGGKWWNGRKSPPPVIFIGGGERGGGGPVPTSATASWRLTGATGPLCALGPLSQVANCGPRSVFLKLVRANLVPGGTLFVAWPVKNWFFCFSKLNQICTLWKAPFYCSKIHQALQYDRTEDKEQLFFWKPV